MVFVQYKKNESLNQYETLLRNKPQIPKHRNNQNRSRRKSKSWFWTDAIVPSLSATEYNWFDRAVR